jgi:hypothetical protein
MPPRWRHFLVRGWYTFGWKQTWTFVPVAFREVGVMAHGSVIRCELLTIFCGVLLSSPLQAATPVDLPGATTVSSTDLSESFRTKAKWEFVIRQDPPQETGGDTVPGSLHFCFVNESAQSCFNSPLNVLGSSQIENPTPTSREPLVVVEVVDGVSLTGSGRSTLIWAYNFKTDQFDQIFDHTVGHNTNGEIRVITNGPLAGDVVIDTAGQHAPYRYDITIYRLENSQYREILRYAGNSKYNDGNPLPVIDAEMPEIERRLHFLKPGDPLPTPARTQCRKLELRNGIEWCEP